jgi:formate dehydrogenase assembly factor FdhD
MEPTPKCWYKEKKGLRRGVGAWMGMERLYQNLPHLERGHHLALFFAVDQAVLVLHRNEGRKAIVDRVICWSAKKGRINFSGSCGEYDDTYSASDELVARVHKEV